MASSKDCFKILNDFDEQDIAELEERAQKLAGKEPVTNAAYLAAAHDLHREYSAQVAPKKETAPAEPDRSSYPYNITDKDVLEEEMGMLPGHLYDKFIDQHGDAFDAGKPEGIRAAQDLLAEHGFDTDAKSGTVTRVVNNPDSPSSAKVKAGSVSTAADAIKQLISSAAEPWHRQVAMRIQRFVGDTQIKFLTPEDMKFMPDIVQERLTANSPAATYLDGKRVTVYFLGDTNEALLLHELIHAATMRALQTAPLALKREVEALRQSIVATLDRTSATEAVGRENQDTAKFFSKVVEDADELFAYAYSSPTFRNWLSNMTDAGQFASEQQAQARKAMDAATEKPKLTMWQKFTDLVRKLLGLNPAHQEKLDQMLIDREAKIAGVVAANKPADLYSKLDKLLEATLAQTAKPQGQTVRAGAQSASPTTLAFKRWFGDSKVVDENGKPLVVYHATTSDFSTFDSAKTANGKYHGDGFYFGDYGLAEGYADSSQEGTNFMPVYLSIANPYTYGKFTPAQVSAMRDKVPGFAQAYDALSPEARAHLSLAQIATSSGRSAFMREALIAAGFDGVFPDPYSKPGSGEAEYVAFYPSQIKSAIGNSGNFDPADPDIRSAAESTRTTNATSGLPEPADDVGFKAKGVRMVKEVSRGWKSYPQMLGFLTGRQLGDRFGVKYPLVKAVVDLSAAMSTKAKHLMGEAREIHQVWQKLDAKVATDLHKLMLESTIDEMHLIDPTATAITKVGFTDKVNGHLEDTPRNRAKFAAMQSRFDALTPEAQTTYHQAQLKAAKDWAERGRLLSERIVDRYRPDLSAAVSNLDQVARLPERQRGAYLAASRLSPNVRRALRSLWGDLDMHAQTLAELRGPYFPLMRFGDHVVVAKSAKFLEAEQLYQAATDNFKQLNDSDGATEEEISAARKEVTEARQAVRELKESNANQYVVEFYEKPTQASDRADQLRKFFADNGAPDTEVYSQLRDQYFGKIDGVTPSFMNKLEESLAANLSDKDAGAVRAAVRDLYIQSMPERSALKQQLNRIGVAGAKVSEVQRAFAASTMRNAWHLSRLEYNLAMHDKLTELRHSDSDEGKILGNELAKRFVNDMTFDTGNGLASWLSNVSYLTYLGMSPSFFVLNAAQPWTISLPIMAGRFGMGAPAAELFKAFKEVGAAMKSSMQDQKTWRFELDLDKFTDPAEKAMLSNLFDKGVIDITIEHDLGSIASGEDQTAWGKTMQMASLPAHHTEVVNRVMTALAAYRLAKNAEVRSGSSPQAIERNATAYAEKIVAETHLDYSPENAPRLMRPSMFGGWGRVIFQFKKYMQGMIYLWTKSIMDAHRGDKEAAKSLAYLTGMMVGTAGATGLPVAGVLAILGKALAQMWDDDDEPEFGQLVYAGLQDAVGETAARALWKGLPAAAGVDLSNRIGQGQLLNPMAFAKDQGKEGGDWVAANLFALAGPAPSMVANWADAAVVAKTDPLKATQMALPKVVGDLLRAYDRAERGVTTRRGDELISPDEFGPLGVAMRAVGFESTDVTDMYDKRTAFNDAKQNRDDARKAIIAEYVSLRRSGESPADLLEKVRGYNERHPTDRITQSQLVQAVARQRQDARSLVGGLRVKARDQELAQKFEPEQ